MLINRAVTLFVAFQFVSSFTPRASERASVFVKHVEIGVGKEENQIEWTNFGENDWRVSIKGFFVGDSGQLFFSEPRTDQMKAFDPSGKFLRKFSDLGTYPIFQYDSTFFGIRTPEDGSGEELVALKKNNGALLYKKKLPFQGGLWTAYEMEDGKLYFSSEGIGIGQVKFFDTQKMIFSANSGLKQYGNRDFNTTCSTYVALGFEKIGRISGYLFFRRVDCKAGSPCLYQVIAGTQKGNALASLTFTFKEEAIGYYMPDVPWVLVQKRYLYTIGYPRTGNKPGNKIMITCIDLQKVFPDIFQATTH